MTLSEQAIMGAYMNLAEHCITKQISALQNLRGVVNTFAFDKIVEEVTKVAKKNYAARVLTAGVGKNANIAAKIAETMMSLGIPAMALNVSHLGHGDFGGIGHEDIIIHISRSGQTREMMVAIEHISKIRPDVIQILVHCKADKPLNPLCDLELFIGAVAEGDEFGLAPTTSTTALLCILDCISVQVSHNIGFHRLDFLKFHPDGKLGEMLKEEEAKTKETLNFISSKL